MLLWAYFHIILKPVNLVPEHRCSAFHRSELIISSRRIHEVLPPGFQFRLQIIVYVTFPEGILSIYMILESVHLNDVVSDQN